MNMFLDSQQSDILFCFVNIDYIIYQLMVCDQRNSLKCTIVTNRLSPSRFTQAYPLMMHINVKTSALFLIIAKLKQTLL